MGQYFGKNYRAVRTCGPFYAFGASKTYMGMTCYKYALWCVPANKWNTVDNLNLHELFDLGLDPWELNNRYSQVSSNPLASRLVDRLDAVLTVMAYCEGPSCRNPWRVLHPDGSANSLVEALSPVFDTYYKQRTKFSFQQCATFYDPTNENADPVIISALEKSLADNR